MLKAFMDLDLRSVWLWLSLSNKVFLLFFSGVSIYSLSLSLYVFLLLRSLKKKPTSESASLTRSPLGVLQKRLSNLRQLHLFTLYLCWFCLAINIPRAFETFGDSKAIQIVQILQNLVFLFYSYAPICLGFLVLHTVQWVVSARVESFACRQD
jgi:hypothetical protein